MPPRPEIQAHLDRGEAQLRARAVAVDHARERPLRHGRAQEIGGIAIGIARMHDQRQTTFPGGLDMHPKHVCLHVARTVVVEVIEAALPDADHLGMRGPRHEPTRTVEGLLGRPVGMHPDRAVDAGIRLGDRQHLLEGAKAGADGLDDGDASRLRPGDHGIALLGQRRKVQMAVAIDQHRPSRPRGAGIRQTAPAARRRG